MATNKMAMYYHMQMFLCGGEDLWPVKMFHPCSDVSNLHNDFNLREFLSLHPYTKSKMAATYTPQWVNVRLSG